jgi:mannosyl-3-phosphoglycerate synthase
MRIEIPREAERFGANLIHGIQKVYEMDSGLPEKNDVGGKVVKRIAYDKLFEIENQMAVVIPVKGEKIKLIEGVLYGIPHQCLVIIVSNSSRSPVDRFQMEKAAIENYCNFTRKNIMVVHQKDPAMAKAFNDAGYPELIGKKGLIKNGKAEGMLMAKMLAKLAGKKYIGFIDADNYFPGAVHEYVKIYAGGFALAASPYSMVRISWSSKPKIVDNELFFAKWGRTSVITNRYLNELMSHYTGFEQEVIKTGNAGEHALTLDLAMMLDYSSGYSVEPYHYMNMLEKFGGLSEPAFPEVMRKGIEIFQIESRNPHLHEQKGEEHVDDMIYAALKVMYHSPVTPENLKRKIVKELKERKIIQSNQKPENAIYYPALSKIDLEKFKNILSDQPYSSVFE